MSEPSIEKLLERFVSGGWDALAQVAADPAKPGPDKAQQAYERVAYAAAAVYNSPDGRVFLEWIFDLTLRKASWHGIVGQSVEQIAAYGLLREGQNSLAALILGAVHKGQGAAAPPVRDPGA